MSLAGFGQVTKGWVLQKQKVGSHFGSDSSNMSWVWVFFFPLCPDLLLRAKNGDNSVDKLMTETRNYSWI